MGNSYDYQKGPVGFLRSNLKRYGDVFRYDKRVIVIGDAALVQRVLARTGQEYSSGEALVPEEAAVRARTAMPFRARRQRAWMLVSPQTVRHYLPVLKDIITREFAQWTQAAVDVTVAAQRLCATAAVAYCVGPNPDVLRATEAASQATLSLIDRTAAGRGDHNDPVVRENLEAEGALMRLLAEVVSRHREGTAELPDCALARILHTSDAGLLSDWDAARIVKASLVGARGTTGAALAWIVNELASRSELMGPGGDGASQRLAVAMDEADVAPLVHEVLRLRPPVWLMARDVVRPARLGDYPIQPGQRVLFSPYLLHRDERWWAEALAFRPTRWSHGSPTPPGTFLPFGGGPRLCLGHHLGNRILMLATTHLMNHYRISLTGQAHGEPTHRKALYTPEGTHARILPVPPTAKL